MKRVRGERTKGIRAEREARMNNKEKSWSTLKVERRSRMKVSRGSSSERGRAKIEEEESKAIFASWCSEGSHSEGRNIGGSTWDKWGERVKT